MKTLLISTAVILAGATQAYSGVVVTKNKKVALGPLKKTGSGLVLTVKRGEITGRMNYKPSAVAWYSLNPKVDSYYTAARQAFKDEKKDVAAFLVNLSLEKESATKDKAEEFKRYMAAMNLKTKTNTQPVDEKVADEQKANVNYEALKGNLIIADGKSVKAFDDKAVKSTDYYLFYYSASWCAPCRAFTPKLVETYKSLKATNSDKFELILMGKDNSNSAYKSYMTNYKMPWPALKYARVKGSDLNKYAGTGIPFLALVDAEGKIISQGQYNVLEKLTELLRQN